MYTNSIFPHKDALDNLVITVLGAEYPLSKMQLFNKIKIHYRKNITYQGVSKVVGQLTGEGVLTKLGRNYSINGEWITKIQDFAKELTQNYGKGAVINKSTTEITFYSLGEFLDFAFDNLNSDFFGIEKNIVVQIKDITFVPLSKHQISELKKCIKSKNMYVAVASNSIIEKAIAGMLKRIGVKVKLGIDCAKNSIIIATENCLMIVYAPHDFRMQIADIYKEAKSFSDLRLVQMYHTILYQPVTLHATISRNKALAEQMLKQTMAFWQ